MKVQTAATLGDDLGQILHGTFTGTIEAHCDRGRLLRWEIQETFKSGRVLLPHPLPRKPELVVGEIEALLQEGFSGRLVLHCNDGSVVRYVRHRTVLPGHLVALEEATAGPSGAKRGRSLS